MWLDGKCGWMDGWMDDGAHRRSHTRAFFSFLFPLRRSTNLAKEASTSWFRLEQETTWSSNDAYVCD